MARLLDTDSTERDSTERSGAHIPDVVRSPATMHPHQAPKHHGKLRRASVWLLGVWLLGIGLSLSACGPVTTASVIADAEHDLAEVRGLDGDKNAPYEYTKAASYLHKAKELQGHGLYEQSGTYARRSRVMSEKALEVARLAQERSQRKAKFGKKPKKKGPPSFTPSGGGGR